MARGIRALDQQPKLTARNQRKKGLQQADDALEETVNGRTKELQSAGSNCKRRNESSHCSWSSVTDYAIFMLDPDGRVMSGIPARGASRDMRHRKSSGSTSRAFIPKKIRSPTCRWPVSGGRPRRTNRAGGLASQKGRQPLLGQHHHRCNPRRRTADGLRQNHPRHHREKARPKRGCAKRRKWKWSANSPAARRTISVIC